MIKMPSSEEKHIKKRNQILLVTFPVAHLQGTKMIKRNLHFKAPLVFLGGTLVK